MPRPYPRARSRSFIEPKPDNSINLHKFLSVGNFLELPIMDNEIPLTPEQLATRINSTLDKFRIPDAIKNIPNFEGNSRLLFDFIENCEEILALCEPINRTSYAKIILRSIRNKITGEANEILNMYGTELNWEKIRENLVLHYSDKRNETCLIQDLHSLRQNSDSVEKYYSKIIEIYSTLINHIKIHETEISAINSKKKLYDELCLNAFLSGLREPLGSIVRAMRPNNLAEAFNFCLKEQNISYLKRIPRQNNYNNFNPNIQRFNISPNRNSENPPLAPFAIRNPPTRVNTNYQNSPNAWRQQPNNIQNPPLAPFAIGNNSRRFNSNSFQSAPVPMELGTGQTRSKFTNFNRPNPNNRYQNELHNTENQCENEDQPDIPYINNIQDDFYNNELDDQIEIDDRNFQATASYNPSDT